MNWKEKVAIFEGVTGFCTGLMSLKIPVWLESLANMSEAFSKIIAFFAGIGGLILLYHSITYHIERKKSLRKDKE